MAALESQVEREMSLVLDYEHDLVPLGAHVETIHERSNADFIERPVGHLDIAGGYPHPTVSQIDHHADRGLVLSFNPQQAFVG